VSRDEVAAAVADAHRREWGFVLAATARVAGSLDIAEECVQDAYGAALDAWLRDGVPRSPGAWLTTTARRRALDVLRREQTLRRKLPLLLDPDDAASADGGVLDRDRAGDGTDAIPDDRLRLVFTCCHPALSREAQVALTLRLVCGLTTDEIARAFLVPETTMAARVTRAKKKIAAARIPYRVPAEADLPERLDAVLTVVHLVFTTGHVAPTGADLVRPDLVARAVDLGRVLRALMPDEGEVTGLLALMLLTDARRDARSGPDGAVVLLEDQDRSRWDEGGIAEGLDLVRAAARAAPGRFLVQAAIAAEHARATTYDRTDWQRILRLYDVLLGLWPSPVVALNRSVAVLMVHGPQAALDEIEALQRDGRLDGYRYLPATRADLLRRLGREDESAAAYREAIVLTGNAAERQFLEGRLAEVSRR
jgi:RNA polymerase sigma-70 factor (ECF subfamily)